MLMSCVFDFFSIYTTFTLHNQTSISIFKISTSKFNVEPQLQASVSNFNLTFQNSIANLIFKFYLQLQTKTLNCNVKYNHNLHLQLHINPVLSNTLQLQTVLCILGFKLHKYWRIKKRQEWTNEQRDE